MYGYTPSAAHTESLVMTVVAILIALVVVIGVVGTLIVTYWEHKP